MIIIKHFSLLSKRIRERKSVYVCERERERKRESQIEICSKNAYLWLSLLKNIVKYITSFWFVRKLI